MTLVSDNKCEKALVKQLTVTVFYHRIKSRTMNSSHHPKFFNQC